MNDKVFVEPRPAPTLATQAIVYDMLAKVILWMDVDVTPAIPAV
jgi:hypothetical protein